MEPRPERAAEATAAVHRPASSTEAEEARADDRPALPVEPAASDKDEMSPADEPSEEREWNGSHATDEPAPRYDEEDDPDKPKRSGWWQRRSFF